MHIPILYMSHPFVQTQNKDIYVTHSGLAAITELHHYCPGKDFFGIEHKIVTLCITRSFTRNKLFKGRPVITEEDVKQACRLSGLEYQEPSKAVKEAATRVIIDKKVVMHSVNANEGFIDNEELKYASEQLGLYEQERKDAEVID